MEKIEEIGVRVFYFSKVAIPNTCYLENRHRNIAIPCSRS